MTRLLSFASGMGLDVAPAEAAAAAAAAGFDAVGFRFDAPGPSDGEVAALRRRVDDLGLSRARHRVRRGSPRTTRPPDGTGGWSSSGRSWAPGTS